MTKLLLICIGIFVCCHISGQVGIGKGIDDIENDSLKILVSGFKQKTLPFTFSESGTENIIDTSLLKSVLNKELSGEDIGLEDYYSQYVFYARNYIGLVITYYYSPGAFGIDNSFIELITLTYSGSVISEVDLGCFCNDTNMGSNDYYSSEIDVSIDSAIIIINEKNTHATLVEYDDTEPFEDITKKTHEFAIDSSGVVSRSK